MCNKLGLFAKVSAVCSEDWPAWQGRSRTLLFLIDSRGCVSSRSEMKCPENVQDEPQSWLSFWEPVCLHWLCTERTQRIKKVTGKKKTCVSGGELLCLTHWTYVIGRKMTQAGAS